VFETGSSSPAIGRSIRILLQAGGAGRSHFDRIRLTATPVSPEILIEQPVGTSLADGTSTATLFAPVNGTASLTFTVRNAGNAALTGLAATVDGADASDFAITTQPAATVAPGGTTTVAVRFSATATGSRVAALHLASNDADENPFDIALSGTGFMPTPGITVEQPAGSGLTDGGSSPFFGAVALGANASRTFTVRNTGASPLLALGAMIDGPNAGDFTLVTPPAALVEVGGVTTLVVRFSPAATGQRRAALHLTYTGGTNPFDITLGGLGGTATTASLHHASRGWYDADGASNAPGTNFATGFSAAGNREVRSFFSFNLPALAAGERFVAAELRLTNPSNGFASSDAWETLRISEVVTPSATLGAGTGGQAVFADLADGPVFGGPTEVSGASNGTTVVIPLNAAFLSQANTRASQQIALGCSLGTLRAVAGVSETIFGSTTSTHTTTLVITKAANNPPMFSGYTLATPYQTPAVIPIRKLLAKASDPDGDMLTVSAADAVSAHGGSVAVRTDSLLYTPAAGRFGADSFGVTISDGRGGTVTGTVTTTIGQAPGAGGIGSNSPVLATLPDGKIGISFQGIPGRTYTVQRSAGGLDDWVTLAIITADAAGRVSFTDESPPPGSGFYRLGVP
jgi:hypothetical protein